MMRQKKKTRGGHHLKYDPAEQKQHFFGKIESICSAVAGPGVYEMIPVKDLNRMFKMRVLPMKMIPAPREKIPDEILKMMRRYATGFLKAMRLPLFEGGPNIALTECISAAETLQYYISDLEDSKYPRASEFKKSMERLTGLEEGAAAVDKLVDAMILWTELTFNDLGSRLYWLEKDYNIRRYGTWGIESFVVVHSRLPEQMHVTLDGISRPAVSVSMASQAYDGVIDVKVRPSELGIQDDGRDVPMDVYIQTHALERLKERLDSIPVGLGDLFLCASLTEPVVHSERDGTFLIEYKIEGKKGGYLAAEVEGGRLIVRTFLFLTNDGTPESRKLRELCGLGRLDREFLAIDKLSTFMATDIKSDKELEKIFLEAGCGDLLDLHDKLEIFNTKEGMASSLPTLKKYLGLGTNRDFLIPDPLNKFRREFEREMEE